ncbi:MAG: SLC13 family permease [Candidatus Bathyarchaeota archaeon]|nr:SLC13 family permease [Candidatus Bathyarchaeota archaeon]
MNLVQSLSVIVFTVTIVLIATEWVDRIFASFLAVASMLVIGAVSPDEVLHFIDIEILGVIVGMMLLVYGAEKSGIFNWIAVKILKASKSPKTFTVNILLFTTFLSIILNNIGAMLISASITIIMTRALKMKPEMLLIFQAIVADLGGMMLLMSSIPNIIVAIEGDIPFLDFMYNIAPLSIILVAITILIFCRFYLGDTVGEFKQEFRSVDQGEWVDDFTGSETEPDVKTELRAAEFNEWIDLSIKEFGVIKWSRKHSVAAIIMTGTIFGFVIYDMIGLTPALVALIGGCLMLVFSGEEPSEVFKEIDWSTIIFLAGLFIMINGMINIGLIEILSISILNIAGRWPDSLHIAIMWLSAIPSGLVDNIPLTATLAPILSSWVLGGVSSDVWWGLVAGANIGGNFTPIGSPSTIIVLGVSEREGHPISMGKFFKICFGITMVHLFVSMIYLYIIFNILYVS